MTSMGYVTDMEEAEGEEKEGGRRGANNGVGEEKRDGRGSYKMLDFFLRFFTLGHKLEHGKGLDLV